jgi:hypothetical protein
VGEVVYHLVPREEPRRAPLVAALTVATALTGSSVGVVALAGVALVTLAGIALVAALLLVAGLVAGLVALLLLVVALVLVVVASGTGGGGDKSCGVKLAWSSKTMKTNE